MSKISKMIILIESIFWWDYNSREAPLRGYRYKNYLPLETIDDIVDQFNYIGFNDLCIYPETDQGVMNTIERLQDLDDLDMVFYFPNSTDKGLWAVYSGHTNQNQTGK